MKRLLIMRHGKAEHGQGKSDFERQLTELGRIQAAEAAKAMLSRELHPQWIIASAAFRARETAQVVQEVFSGTGELILEKDLYLCSVEDLIQACWICPPEVQTLLLVGHNPTMEYLTDRVIQGDCRIKTSEIRSFELERSDWNGLSLEELSYQGQIYTH